jgi:hypothetical protein
MTEALEEGRRSLIWEAIHCIIALIASKVTYLAFQMFMYLMFCSIHGESVS